MLALILIRLCLFRVMKYDALLSYTILGFAYKLMDSPPVEKWVGSYIGDDPIRMLKVQKIIDRLFLTAHYKFEQLIKIFLEKGDKVMKAIDPEKIVDFIAKQEQGDKVDEEAKTVFKVRMLRAKEAAELRDDLYTISGSGKERKEQLKSGTAELKALKKGLKGWENFLDNDGKEVEFDSTKLDKMLDMIPPDVRVELADFIRGESSLADLE